ncbi:MFS sugar transporter [Haladaptatus sp. R4]|nr:MFS sugar transporter [Haladaptatus sp. R4]
MSRFFPYPAALLALTISAFAIGTNEFIIVGLLTPIGTDLGVSVATAGLLVSLYALAVAFGAPVITGLTSRIGRRTLLLSLMGLFVAGNVVAAFAPTYELLVLARILTGFAHGVFFAIGSTIAVDIVREERESSAIAIMFAGLTVATATGVPFGTYIGQNFGWQTTFWAIVLLGVVGFVSSWILVPRDLEHKEQGSFVDQISALTEGQILLVLAMTAIGYGGTFVAFTYLEPILREISGFEPTTVSALLVLYGAGVFVGNLSGGRLSDRFGAVQTLVGLFAVQAVVLAAFTFTASDPTWSIVTVFFLGVVGFANVPPLQTYIVNKAERLAPEAVNVVSGLNIGAFNVGIAVGAYVGGWVTGFNNGLGLIDTPWIGALFVVGGLALTIVSWLLDRQQSASKSSAAVTAD